MPVRNDVLTPEERAGLTIWGDTISAQIRDGHTLALHVMDDAPRSTEDGHPALLPAADVAKLRELLDEAHRRALENPDAYFAPPRGDTNGHQERRWEQP